MDTIGYLQGTSRGRQWALTAICMNTSYVFAIPMKEESVENVVQSYLSGIFAPNGGSITILSYNGTEFKSTALNKACDQLGIRRLFSNPIPLQGNSRIENVHNFQKGILSKF